MDIEHLPKYRSLSTTKPDCTNPCHGISIRGVRVVLDLVFVAALAVALYTLRPVVLAQESPPSPRSPLDFNIIEKRFPLLLPFGSSREEVEALLGPPTRRNVWDCEIHAREQNLWRSSRGILPEERIWDQWTDPDDESRRVLILYKIENQKSTVFLAFKQGF